jgi:hypothetical protein
MGGPMHFFNNIFQFRSGNKVYSKTFNLKGDDPSCFYSGVFTLKANNKTYYLAVGNGVYSSKDVSQFINIFAIENDSLNSTVKLIKTQSELTSQIGINFDFFSVVDRPERPLKLIKYDTQKKIIYIPVLKEDGAVTDKFILYQFTGKYFEEISVQK